MRDPEQQQSYTGRCFCGAAAYVIKGLINGLCCCHCDSCRRSSGAPFVAWGTIGIRALTLDQGSLSYHASSVGVQRGFCPNCGTSMTYFNEVRPAHLDINLVTLDAGHGLQPECHIWIADKLPWVQLADGLPQFAEWKT
jgi:hypothetical protein